MPGRRPASSRRVPGRLSVGPIRLRQSGLLPSTSSVFDCRTNIVAGGYDSDHLGAVDDSRAKGQRAQVCQVAYCTGEVMVSSDRLRAGKKERRGQ